jgi:predicted phosphodiesterase
MRLLVLSDIHANLPAFECVFENAQDEWDRIWCLGDLIGYGPDPNECVSLLRQYEHVSLSGNHDWAVLEKLDLQTFNEDAREAIQWTRSRLTEENRSYLQELPSITVEKPFTLAHASPRQPVWEYVLDRATAAENFPEFDTPYCLVGHSHVPMIFEQLSEYEVEWYAPLYDQPVSLNRNRLIINPGSVGQPRDYDPRASYGLLDLEEMTWEHRRVTYPVEKTQSRMTEHGLPERLISRLEYGL